MPLFHPLPPSRPGSPPSSPTALLHSQGLPSSTTSTPPFSPSSFAPRRKSINVFHPDTSVPIPPSLQKSPFLTHEASPFRRRSIEPAGKEEGLVGAGGLKGAGGGGGGGTAMMSRFDSGYSEGGGGMGEGSSSDEDSSASENGSGVHQHQPTSPLPRQLSTDLLRVLLQHVFLLPIPSPPSTDLSKSTLVYSGPSSYSSSGLPPVTEHVL
ncbi:hypothetical protein BDY24DRAFT_444955 [Mrakia frigida]|uniref:uncharacterized protein n=1 Tax=Mrakia frigida TaxID=29902 RepID=UPI003FCBF840